MKLKSTVLLIVMGLLLAACAPAVTELVAGEERASAAPAGEETAGEEVAGGRPGDASAAALDTGRGWSSEALTDRQGAVTVVIRPLNLAAPGDTLDFEVSLDTHSVDLSMDLAGLVTLATGNGREVQALLWDAPRGGHHVSGTLSFPAITDSGEALLAGASELILIVRDVGVAERRFVWQK